MSTPRGGIAVKRLYKEASDMLVDPVDGIIAGPKGGDDLFKWEGIVRCVSCMIARGAPARYATQTEPHSHQRTCAPLSPTSSRVVQRAERNDVRAWLLSLHPQLSKRLPA